jgi:hypothetical protein
VVVEVVAVVCAEPTREMVVCPGASRIAGQSCFVAFGHRDGGGYCLSCVCTGAQAIVEVIECSEVVGAPSGVLHMRKARCACR